MFTFLSLKLAFKIWYSSPTCLLLHKQHKWFLWVDCIKCNQNLVVLTWHNYEKNYTDIYKFLTFISSFQYEYGQYTSTKQFNSVQFCVKDWQIALERLIFFVFLIFWPCVLRIKFFFKEKRQDSIILLFVIKNVFYLWKYGRFILNENKG